MTMLDQRQKVRREPVRVELKKPRRRIGYGWMIWVLAILVAAGGGIGLGYLLYNEEPVAVEAQPLTGQQYLESLVTQGLIPAAALEPAIPETLMTVSGSERDLLELLVTRGLVAAETIDWQLLELKDLVNRGLVPEAALEPSYGIYSPYINPYSFPISAQMFEAPEYFDFSPELFDMYETELWRHVGLISFGPRGDFDFSTFDYFETKVWTDAGMAVPEGGITDYPPMPDHGPEVDPVAPGVVIHV